MACLSTNSHAGDQRYSWVLEQYTKNDTSEIKAHASGQIDGNRYITLLVDRVAPDEDYDPIILVFKESGISFIAVAKISLQGDDTDGYAVSIRNNSIYIESWTAHHGVFGIRYQFKQIDNEFKMIGAEIQSRQSGCYEGGEVARCAEGEFWSGTSYDFLTSSAICWQKVVDDRNKGEMEEESRRSEAFLRPKVGVSHKMSFDRINPPLLDKFDLFEFSFPEACYYDVKNRLQLIRTQP